MDGVRAIEQLAAGIDAVLALDPDTMTELELTETVIALQRQTNRLTAARAQVIGAWDTRQGWAADSCRSAAAVLRH